MYGCVQRSGSKLFLFLLRRGRRSRSQPSNSEHSSYLRCGLEPHNDLQALARAHRLGQRDAVRYTDRSRATSRGRIVAVAKRKLCLSMSSCRVPAPKSVEGRIDDVLYGASELFSSGAAADVDASAQRYGDGNTNKPRSSGRRRRRGVAASRARRRYEDGSTPVGEKRLAKLMDF